jgi:hypothetical protein
MLEDVADALRYLHAQSPGIVHRDIKPGNIIRRRDGSYAIVDFGSVRDRLRPAGGSTVVGTFGYMAPEQFQGRASPKSDVYGAAATALAMLTGEEPEDLPHQGLGIDVARAAPATRAHGDARAGPGSPRVLDRRGARRSRSAPDQRRREADEQTRGAKSRAARATRGAKAAKAAKAGAAPTVAHAEPSAVSSAPRRPPRPARGLDRGHGDGGIRRPPVLNVLSLVFGASLRRGAAACVRASHESQQAFLRASSWLDGTRGDPRIRIEMADETGTRAEPRARVAADQRREGDGEQAAQDEPDAEERKRRARA